MCKDSEEGEARVLSEASKSETKQHSSCCGGSVSRVPAPEWQGNDQAGTVSGH